MRMLAFWVLIIALGTTIQAGERKREPLSPKKIMKVFQLDEEWKVTKAGVSREKLCAHTERFYTREFKAKKATITLEIATPDKPGYHMLELVIDDLAYLFSVGHWNNSATLVTGVHRRIRLRVPDKEYHKIEMEYTDGIITCRYDGKDVIKINAPRAANKIKIGFGSHLRRIEIRKVYIRLVR
ncbi:MAG TPA: hypothetical protein ENH11_01355 [Candidatus Acetothermia bacterium]|nr:hypothetical protein [Candidatus Acetothermia bacterium]